MLSTSAYALYYMPIPMVTVFKNVGLCIIAAGDTVFFGKIHNLKIKISLILILAGSLLAAITDVMFTAEGY